MVRKYILPGAPREISLEAETREELLERVRDEGPMADIFDAVQQHVFQELFSGAYRAFVAKAKKEDNAQRQACEKVKQATRRGVSESTTVRRTARMRKTLRNAFPAPWHTLSSAGSSHGSGDEATRSGKQEQHMHTSLCKMLVETYGADELVVGRHEAPFTLPIPLNVLPSLQFEAPRGPHGAPPYTALVSMRLVASVRRVGRSPVHSPAVLVMVSLLCFC